MGTSNSIGIVLGTGPSLTAALPVIAELRERGARVYGVNNTFEHCALDSHIACDPKWHALYSPVEGNFEKWHWDETICERYGYRHIPGMWYDGRRWVKHLKEITGDPVGQLSTDEKFIAYNHCSAAQALNRATLDGRDPALLVGHDFRYQAGQDRHYFAGLSREPGEYPVSLRKFSTFEGLIETYRGIARQSGLPRIVNCTPGSALPWFEFADLTDFLGC